MLRVLGLALSCAFLLGLTSVAKAADKEVELKGKICCAKCELNESKTCATVIKAKDKDGKDVVYYFDKAAHGKHHKAICQEAKEGVVVGTVKKDGDKMIVTVKKVEFK